jgi:hypothetical protein
MKIGSPSSVLANDAAFWHSLKEAISLSSGFQRWEIDLASGDRTLDLDDRVRRYLRETLETLAY